MVFSHPRARISNFRFFTAFVIITIHLLAGLSLFHFSWHGLVAFVLFYFLTGCLGITLTFHRMLSHKSFKMAWPLRYFTVFLGCLALQGGPLWWCSNHRLHHRESDKELDPHSPTAGFIWAHVGWLFFNHPQVRNMDDYKRFVPEMAADPMLRFFENFFLPINILFGVGLYLGSSYLWGPEIALSILIWGGFLRIVATWHVTWLVNSATHIWGYQRYDAKDDSRNNWLVALLTFGEGWHNNHHAHQRAAASGHCWYEFDLTYLIIKVLSWVGLVSDIVPLSRKERQLTKLVKNPSPV